MYEYIYVIFQIYRDDWLSINFFSFIVKNIEVKEVDWWMCY